jgi:hypothetical protein
LLDKRFPLREIYPGECGCANDGRSGLHWTPIDGTTLLHLALDFSEKDVFEWLLVQEADVNARALVDTDGFGGHTPLFNAVLGHPGQDATMAAELLRRGADKDLRASLRKFIDWCETPRWHAARDVTAVEWGRGFPERNWVNPEVLRLLDS